MTITDYTLRMDFDEGTGSTTAGDGTHTGTLNNSPTWTSPGQIGASCLSFSGLSSSATNVSIPTYTIPTTGTLSFWFRPTRAHNSSTDEHVFGLSTGTPVFQFRKFSDNQIYAGFYQGGGQDYRAIITATAGNWTQSTWQHYTMTWTSGGVVTLYRNATSLGTSSGTLNSTLTANTLRIGSDASQATGASGLIDDFRIYDRVLSGDEINSLYAYRAFQVAWARGSNVLVGAA